VLTVTQLLRQFGVVDKFVEFCGPGLDELPLADRATIANMAPEYGATCGFFPIDRITLDYLTLTGATQPPWLWSRPMPRPGLWRAAGTPILNSPRYWNSTWARYGRAWPGQSDRRTGSIWRP